MRLIKKAFLITGFILSSSIPCFAAPSSSSSFNAVSLIPIINPNELYTISVDCGDSNDFKYCSVKHVAIFNDAFKNYQNRVIHIRTNSFSKLPNQPVCDIFSHDSAHNIFSDHIVKEEVIDSVVPYQGYYCYAYTHMNEKHRSRTVIFTAVPNK